MKWFSDKSMPGPMRELLGEEVLPYIVDRSDIKDLARIANDPHENPLVRAAAVRSLGAIGSKSATQAIEAVKGSSGAQHAIEIEKIRALGKSGAKDGIPYLLTELNSNDDYTRVAAASSLESIAVKSREPSIANPVRQMLYDKSFQYKPAVISLLGNSGDRESIPELGDLLKDRAQTYSTRFMAAMALGKLGGKESAQILMSEAEDKTETDEGVRALSAEAAVKAGVDPDKAPILEGVLVTIKDPYLRKRLSGAIQQLKSRR